MQWADLAVSTASTAMSELCLLGVPAVVMAVVPNQEAPAERFDRAGAVVRVDPLPTEVVAAVDGLSPDRARRQVMGDVGRSLIDGRGAERVVTRLRADLLELRVLDRRDTDVVLGWANDPVTRASSFSTAPITVEQHEAWMERRISSPASHAFLARDHGGDDVGIVRFEVGPETATIGVTVAPEQRGKGWAAALIDAGCRRLAAVIPGVQIEARVKESNPASTRAFLAADFHEETHGDEGVRRYGRVLT
jgi:RimJ/RimL family protein N-acetyltransferase